MFRRSRGRALEPELVSEGEVSEEDIVPSGNRLKRRARALSAVAETAEVDPPGLVVALAWRLE